MRKVNYGHLSAAFSTTPSTHAAQISDTDIVSIFPFLLYTDIPGRFLPKEMREYTLIT